MEADRKFGGALLRDEVLFGRLPVNQGRTHDLESGMSAEALARGRCFHVPLAEA